MKMFHKTLAIGAALAFAVMGTVFADGKISFENKISTNTYRIGDYNGNQCFPGIAERMKIEYLGDKIDAKADISFWLYRYNDDIEKKQSDGI